MKRIKSACLIQKVHFQLKENLGHAAAVKYAQDEYEQYKSRMDRTRTKYKIIGEETQPDGSIVIEIKKQYNNHDTGNYLE